MFNQILGRDLMSFKNILVPYDGTRLSEKGLKLALEIAKMASNSKVSILNVIEDIPLPSTRFNMKFHSTKTGEDLPAAAYFKDLYKDMQSNMRKKLEKKIAQFCEKEPTISIKVHVLIGSPPEKIIEFANHHKVDLIVIGSAGLRGISKFYKCLGSVSRNVSEKVSCPILIVR
jgi:nucleotide-binding universal stress UspA family protein